MNSLLIGTIALFLLFLGYRFYGRIAERLWQIDPERKTPAIEKKDGVDYIPAKNWLILTHPNISTPAYISWRGNAGFLWPMVCVVIACGAISGFHSLVASGTTAKQLPNEKDAKKIGYGAMIVEGVLAILAVLAVSAGLYWSKASGHLNLIYPDYPLYQ